jgi:M6 family metalloprotease-like protein
MSFSLGVIGRARKAFFVSAACFALLMVTVPSALAVPANPNPFQEVQPDGTLVSLRVRGDEHFNWTEDMAGYTVIRAKGWYEYARVNPQGRLVPTGLKVGLNNPKANGLSPGLLPSAAQRAQSVKTSTSSSSLSSAQSTVPSGSVKNLVVLIQFSNHVGRALPSSSDIDVLFNAPGGDPVLAPTGSVRDVYLQNSYGQMELNSDVSSWITVSGTEQYYADGVSGDSGLLWEALREALDILDSSVDFSQYDANHDGYIDSIAFIHSGYGAEWGGTDADGTAQADRLWSHRWAIQDPVWTSNEGVWVSDYHISPGLWNTRGSAIGRIGVIAHETGHFFGLPDLYDTDGGGHGIGSFGLMANSWGFDGSQLCPPHFSPWSKVQLGWTDPVNISMSGVYSIGQSETNNEYFVISAGYASNEYLMIENRQNAGFDCSLSNGGLAIWHIDDEAGFNTEGYPHGPWPKNGKHYRIALAQADGLFDLETGRNRGSHYDLHRASAVDAMVPGPDGHPNTDGYQSGVIVNTGHTISHISESGPVMTFCLNGCASDGGGGDPEPGGGYEAPSNLAASVSTSGKGKNAIRNISLSWSDNSNGADNEDTFVIERCLESGKGKNKTCNFSQRATVGQDVTSYSESPGSGTFKYRVKARRGSNDDTGYSNEVKI